MATSDLRAARTAAFGVVLVAITAAVISFSHVRSLAMRAGESELTSWLLPISIDGAVVAAVAVLLADSRAGRRPAALTWLFLTFGLAASLAANVASAEPTHIARVVFAWPPVALALGIDVLAGLARRGDHDQVDDDAALQPWRIPADSNATSGNGNGATSNGRAADGNLGTMPVRQAANGDGRGRYRQAEVDDDSAIQMIRELDNASPTGQVSRLEIQKKLGCGGSRAARLAELARRQELDAAG
jgi:hypothetical protein